MTLPDGTYDVVLVIGPNTPPDVRQHLEELWQLAAASDGKVLAQRREYSYPSLSEHEFCDEFGSDRHHDARQIWDALYRILRPSTIGACVLGHLEIRAVQKELGNEGFLEEALSKERFPSFKGTDISHTISVLKKLTDQHPPEE